MTQVEFLSMLRKENEQYFFDGRITGTREGLYCPGTLTVCGDIDSGTTLVVEGDVIVHGSVFDVSLTATGNVTIEESFIGTGRGKITSGIDVNVKAVNMQSIVAKGNIAISAEALNADLRAYDKIDAPFARIIGGKCEASNEIVIKTLGSDDARQTKVYLGNKKKLLQRLNDILNEKKSLEERLPKINNCIYRWNRIRIEGIVLTPEQELMLDKLRLIRDSFPRQRELFEKENENLKVLLKNKAESTLCVNDVIHENVLVDINGIKEVTDCQYRSVKFCMGAHKLFRAPL
jgi:uncharacterized protein (DUF342 family)